MQLYTRAFDYGPTTGKISALLQISQCNLEMGRWGDVDTANNKLAIMCSDDAEYVRMPTVMRHLDAIVVQSLSLCGL